MKTKLFIAAVTASALSGCMGSGGGGGPSGLTPQGIANRTVEIVDNLESRSGEELTMPTSGSATYSGGVGIVYTDVGSDPSEDTVVPTMIGEMTMEANFADLGATVNGSLSGFYASDSITLENAGMVVTGEIDTLPESEQQALLASFDTSVDGSIAVTGNGVSSEDGYLAAGVNGVLTNGGKELSVGGEVVMAFGMEDADFIYLEGMTAADGGAGTGLTLSEDGVEQFGSIFGLAEKNE